MFSYGRWTQTKPPVLDRIPLISTFHSKIECKHLATRIRLALVTFFSIFADLPRIDRNISSNTISCDRQTKCILFCYASSKGPVRYTWAKDGKSLNSSDVIIINNALVINPRTKGDYGLYVCKVENEAGSVELVMNVTENSGRTVPFSTKKEINGKFCFLQREYYR